MSMTGQRGSFQRLSFSELESTAPGAIPWDAPDMPSLATEQLDGEPGFAIVSGLPLDQRDESAARRIVLGLCRRIGQPIWQDEVGSLTWLVRDEGVHDLGDRGVEHAIDVRTAAKYSHSSSALPFHTDGAAGWLGQDVDVMGLAALHTDKNGGDTLLLDSVGVFEALLEENMEFAFRLSQPLPRNRSSACLAEQSPVVRLPMFSWERSDFRARFNPRRVRATLIDLGEDDGIVFEALDLLEQIMERSEFHLRIHLNDGECLFVDERRVAHARDAFRDPSRVMVRVWLHRPRPHMTEIRWPIDMA